MGRVNTLRIADRIYLLVHGTGGTAHLAAEQRQGGRAAFLDDDFEMAGKRGWKGEDVALREPRWSPKSLCGNLWACMSPTEETRSFFYWDVGGGVRARLQEVPQEARPPSPSRLFWTTWDV